MQRNEDEISDILDLIQSCDRMTKRNAISYLLAITPESTLNQFCSYLCRVSQYKDLCSDRVKSTGRTIEVIGNGRNKRRSYTKNP